MLKLEQARGLLGGQGSLPSLGPGVKLIGIWKHQTLSEQML